MYTSLKSQRQHYANSFLERCTETSERINPDPNQDEINRYTKGPGTYLAVWLRRQVPAVNRCTNCDQPLYDATSPCYRCRYSNPEWLNSGVPTHRTQEADEVTEETVDRWARIWHSDKGQVTIEPRLRDASYPNHGSDPIRFGNDFLPASLHGSPDCPHYPPRYYPAALQVHVLPSPEAFVTEFPRSERQSELLVYTKECAWMWEAFQYTDEEEDQEELANAPDFFRWLNDGLCPFLKIPDSGLNSSIRNLGLSDESPPQQHGGSDCDVWSLQLGSAQGVIVSNIRILLDRLAKMTNDRPIPKYEMIIDPNQFVRTRKSDGKTVWVPSEFDVSLDGSVQWVGGKRGHWMDVDIVQQVSIPVLERALPLLSRLKKPHLLLEGNRLQVVIKAQRIVLPPSRDDEELSDYVGLWHIDGENEAVVAVVLFYYHVDSALRGGNMEFIDRRPIDVLGEGDTYHNFEDFNRHTLHHALRTSNGGDPIIPNCSVPIKTGTLLVFSNYQMAHRVLRMVNNNKEQSASRDFVALFILDPAADPLVPSRCHLARSFLHERLITGIQANNDDSEKVVLNRDAAILILEFAGLVPSLGERRRLRNELLLSQLRPKGRLGNSGAPVTCTGNGCFTMIGWLSNLLLESSNEQNNFEGAGRRAEALNMAPRQVGRGLSDSLSVPSDQLETYLLHCSNTKRAKLEDPAI